jgi:hypothetical protein
VVEAVRQIAERAGPGLVSMGVFLRDFMLGGSGEVFTPTLGG